MIKMRYCKKQIWISIILKTLFKNLLNTKPFNLLEIE